MKRTVLFLMSLAPVLLIAQSLDKMSANDRMGVLYTKDASCGLRIITNGWALFGNLGKSINLNRSRFYQVEFAELKNPREKKQTSDNFGGADYPPRPYVFGKENVFFALHVGIGRKYLLGEKAEKSGVEVTLNYVLGPSLGILKPYYLDLIYTSDPGSPRRSTHSEKYSEENAPKFLDHTQIYGSSGFSKGLSEIRPIPGLHAKVGINFDWASFGDFIKALEVGVTADVYYKRVPIMISDHHQNNPNRAYFIGLYLSGQVGKKW